MRPAFREGPAPHIEVLPGSSPAPSDRDGPGDRLRATLDRWARLDATLPDALIRRGLVALRLDRETLAEAAAPALAGRRETRIHESAYFAVDVLAWPPGHLGPIREQTDSARGLLVAEGTATEIHFEESPCGLLAPALSRLVPTGAVSVARAGDIRAFGNLQAPGVELLAILVTSPADPGRLRRLSETVFGEPGAAGCNGEIGRHDHR
jgi:hypothetical protein